uniref:Uncharacterized protein n=1 Tax=Pseudo-nitzschia delicatissima TaxID=44447 RepID=A0A7S0XK36_9STRA|mmetsp:Transcript_1648/g.3843  ORF Transcript_1648/g.3843 Transcript_1648/m.3843 type:complete len:351 (+) Transcript_1648:88-1140(+)
MMATMMSGKVDEGSASRNRNSFFREEQTDLLNPFQGHHYDLLAGNPPPRNPDFVSNPPPHNPDFLPSSERSFSASLPRTSTRQSSHSMFEDLLAPSNRSSNPFESPELHAPVSPISNRTSFVDSAAARNHSEASSSSSLPVATESSGDFSSVPVASVVAISDNDDDSAIPFASALPIDDETVRVVSSGSSETPPLHASTPGPAAVRAARPRRTAHPTEIAAQGRVRPPPLDFSRADERPEWLGRSATNTNTRGNSTSRPGASSSALTSTRTTINWSRISVQAKAIAKDAKRSLKKTFKKETKKLKKTISATPLARSIREDMDRMLSSSCSTTTRPTSTSSTSRHHPRHRR